MERVWLTSNLHVEMKTVGRQETGEPASLPAQASVVDSPVAVLV